MLKHPYIMITSLIEEEYEYLQSQFKYRDDEVTGFFVNSRHELRMFGLSKTQIEGSLSPKEFMTTDFNEFITRYEQLQLLKILGE